MFLRILHNFFVYLIAIVTYILGTPLALFVSLFTKNKIKPFQIAAHIWASMLIFISGSKVEVKGAENAPKDTACIIVANHQGVADVPLVLAFLPLPFRFAIKKELFGVPIFGWYLRKAGYFSVDRKVILSAYKTLEVIVEIIKGGDSVLIFPEGTRSSDGAMGKFKRGSLMAALKAGAPILPVAISGSYDIMPRKTYLFRPAKVKFSIGKVIYIKTEEEYDAKLEEVRSAISAML